MKRHIHRFDSLEANQLIGSTLKTQDSIFFSDHVLRMHNGLKLLKLKDQLPLSLKDSGFDVQQTFSQYLHICRTKGDLVELDEIFPVSHDAEDFDEVPFAHQHWQPEVDGINATLASHQQHDLAQEQEIQNGITTALAGGGSIANHLAAYSDASSNIPLKDATLNTFVGNLECAQLEVNKIGDSTPVAELNASLLQANYISREAGTSSGIGSGAAPYADVFMSNAYANEAELTSVFPKQADQGTSKLGTSAIPYENGYVDTIEVDHTVPSSRNRTMSSIGIDSKRYGYGYFDELSVTGTIDAPKMKIKSKGSVRICSFLGILTPPLHRDARFKRCLKCSFLPYFCQIWWQVIRRLKVVKK